MSVIAVRETPDSKCELHVRCLRCDELHLLNVRAADYARYLDRSDLIQNIFPYLEAPFRELLISGTCPDCWTAIFGTPETNEEGEEGEA